MFIFAVYITLNKFSEGKRAIKWMVWFICNCLHLGPRPLVEGELELHDGLNLYNKVKPGITEWWACNGRSNIEYRERLELEYYYIKNCSLTLDIMCIFRTILCVLKKKELNRLQNDDFIYCWMLR